MMHISCVFEYEWTLFFASVLPFVLIVYAWIAVIVGVPTNTSCYPYRETRPNEVILIVATITTILPGLFSILSRRWWVNLFMSTVMPLDKYLQEPIPRSLLISDTPAHFPMYFYPPVFNFFAAFSALVSALIIFGSAMGLITIETSGTCGHSGIWPSFVLHGIAFALLIWFLYLQQKYSEKWFRHGVQMYKKTK